MKKTKLQEKNYLQDQIRKYNGIANEFSHKLKEMELENLQKEMSKYIGKTYIHKKDNVYFKGVHCYYKILGNINIIRNSVEVIKISLNDKVWGTQIDYHSVGICENKPNFFVAEGCFSNSETNEIKESEFDLKFQEAINLLIKVKS